jgi:hypothetical protein
MMVDVGVSPGAATASAGGLDRQIEIAAWRYGRFPDMGTGWGSV